jgi:hypothetical protein
MKRLILIDEAERPDTYYLIEAVKRRLLEALDLEDPYDPEFAEDPYLDMFEEEEKQALLKAIEDFVGLSD